MMSSKETIVRGRHWESGDWIEIRCDATSILSVEPIAEDGDNSTWLAPGLLDLQVNGYGGVDFQQPDLSANDLHTAASILRRDACPRFFLTLITAPWQTLIDQLRRIKAIRDSDPSLRQSIAGWHIEGPFLSEEPGYCGAHRVEHMENPSVDRIRALRSVTGTDPVLLTLAPERPGSMEAIAEADKLGMRVSLGHTNSDADTLRQAERAGASGFTHLGNACPQQLDRHDNLLFRALDAGNWMTGLIPDTHHVSPMLFRILHRIIPDHQIYYTTDAMAAAGAPPGTYPLADMMLEVREDQIVRQPGRSNFAGSALSPRQGIERAAAMLHCDWRKVWNHFSVIPARWMGLPTGLVPGAPSAFCRIETTSDEVFKMHPNSAS